MGRVGGLVVLAVLLLSARAWAAFPADPPNDPAYAPAERGPLTDCLNRSADDEQHYLFSFLPRCARQARDPENAAGMSVDRAWREYSTGDPNTVIAYVEGGINWRDEPRELADKVFLNAGELPPPTTTVADGVLSARDYADTRDANGNGVVDPEDLIVRFSNGRDEDGNGYVDDISGWDFYDDQNDPATLDSAYDHANSQMRQAAAETDNGIAGAGIRPRCRILPIKAGAEALDRTDDLAQAWLYATDMRADVLVSVTADLGYSSFVRDAVEYAWRHGVLPVAASNDFNSTDHQGGMFWPHVVPGNGSVADLHGLDRLPGGALLQNQNIRTFRARSSFTSWGTHNLFTAATAGGTTSESTPTLGGVLALVRAWGRQAARRGLIARPLSPSEAVQVVRATASDVAANPNPPNGWPARPGWDLQFGYGRPNAHRALQAIAAGDIPPEAWFDAPRWYALFDPTRTRAVTIRGHVAAPRSPSYRWGLEFAPGAEPSDAEFRPIAGGTGRRPYDGALGRLDLSRVPASFWRRAFALSRTKTLETNEEYTVTLRLRVTDASGRVGEERRAIAVHHDPSLRRGFPRFLGPGGESQPALADLDGNGRLDIVLGDADGRVHAFDPRGRELPGFPVTTDPTRVTRAHAGVDPGHEPVFTNPAVGDLDHDGRQWIVATSSTGRVYVWDGRGRRRPGWPRTLASGVRRPAIPRPAEPFTRPAIRGATAPPVLADLNGDERLEVVQAGWDGRLHAWRPDGRTLPGWPVRVTLPPGTTTPPGLVPIHDEKLDLPPALAELDGDRTPELVQRTQRSWVKGSGLQLPDGGISNVVAYDADGTRVPGFRLAGRALAFYYGSAQEFVTEGVQNPSTADVDGDGRTEIASAAGIFSPTVLYGPDGGERRVLARLPDDVLRAFSTLGRLLDLAQGDLPGDLPVNFTTSGAFGRFGSAGLAYLEPGSGALSGGGSLLLTGSGLPIWSYLRGFDPRTGFPLAGLPARAQGLDFLGAPVLADVTGDGAPEAIQGGDSSALHAYTGAGAQAPGFPKFHTGWIVFGPSAGDLDANGRTEIAAATREGYLMVWNTAGRAGANDQWWSYRHDERNTGRYGIDTRPPRAVPGALMAGRDLVFTAPGDDGDAGRAAVYEVRAAGRRIRVRPRFGAGTRVAIRLPAGARAVRVRAEDEAANLGPWERVAR